MTLLVTGLLRCLRCIVDNELGSLCIACSVWLAADVFSFQQEAGDIESYGVTFLRVCVCVLGGSQWYESEPYTQTQQQTRLWIPGSLGLDGGES